MGMTNDMAFSFIHVLLFTCSYSGIATAYFLVSSPPKVFDRHVVSRAYLLSTRKIWVFMHAINGYRKWLLHFWHAHFANTNYMLHPLLLNDRSEVINPLFVT